MERVDDLIENLEDAGIIDEEMADDLEKAVDTIEDVVEKV